MTIDLDSLRRGKFEALYESQEDPWRYRERWYERRKRALTLACLPRERYASIYEPACSIGELSACLALRCDRLLVSDGSQAAVSMARQRLAPFAHAQAAQAWMPQDWPDGIFDLIVISEVGYYLRPVELEGLASRARASLAPGGDVLACHWRHPIDDGQTPSDEVHRLLSRGLGLPSVWSLEDPDFRLEVWSGDTRSVAFREALG